jgi:hypothetical protein
VEAFNAAAKLSATPARISFFIKSSPLFFQNFRLRVSNTLEAYLLKGA